ncbi:MAG: fimbrillin family protein [Rikenellaceae bacterium]
MKRLILASLAVAALASCSKESSVDVAISSVQIPIQYSTYASSSSIAKGNPVDSNTEFKGTSNEFEVSAYALLAAGSTATTTFGKYFGFSTVQYSGSAWSNVDDMYYPNEDATLYFGAYYPSSAEGLGTTPTFVTTEAGVQTLTIPYTVLGDYPSANGKAVEDQDDLMYAVTSYAYTAPLSSAADSDATVETSNVVNLHFKHALTQVAFTATKDTDLEVVVKSITICNVVNSGTFTTSTVTDTSATSTLEDGTVESANVDLDDAGTWAQGDAYNHYVAAMNGSATSITVGSEVTTLTDADNALMLIPQTLTAWDPTDDEDVSSNAYLAIECTVKHADADVAIIDGTVFVPFSTANIDYAEDAKAEDGTWAPGYKITYNLVFGGGYTYPGDPDPEIPEPGETPDPDEVIPTLRAITYTTTVDEWVPTSGGNVAL